MNYEILGVFFFLVLLITSIFFTIINIKRNKNLSIRQKNNLIFLQIYLPFVGPIIYYSIFK